MKPYEQIRGELLASYRIGSRFVDFEGGEPTLWHDGGHTLNDLYALAKKIGFFSCTLTTNGQRPFADTAADSVWVSVDGFRKYHDLIRGEGTFDTLDQNIRSSGRDDVSINMAVNRLNAASVRETIQYAGDAPYIRSISLNFHTPFPGTEQLMLPWKERVDCIEEIIALKKQGYPIMNSVSGLRHMLERDMDRPCWITNYILVNGERLRECAGRKYGICADCGFCMSGEMKAVMQLRPDTLFAGIRLRLR